MKSKKKVAKQAMFAAMTNMMLLLTMIMMILVGRYLGDEALGTFSFAQSLAMIVVGFGNFGLATLIIREVAKDNELAPKYFAAVVPWVALLSTIILLGMFAVVLVMHRDNTMLVMVCGLMGAAVLFRTVAQIARGVLQGLQRFDYECGATALENLVMIPVGVLLLLAYQDSPNGLLYFTIGLMVSRFAGMLFLFGGLRRIIPLRLTIDVPLVKSLQWQSLSIGASKSIHFASIHVDTLLITAFVTFAQVGQFNAAFKVYVGTMIVPMFAVSLLLPKLSASMFGKKRSHNALLLAGAGGLLGMGIVTAVACYFLAPWGIDLLYGDGFDEAIPVMRLLGWAMIPTFLFFFMNGYLVAIGRNKAYLAFTSLGLGLRLVLGAVMVWRFGIEGTAMTIIISETIAVLGIWAYLLRTHFKPGPPRQMLTKLRLALSELSLN